MLTNYVLGILSVALALAGHIPQKLSNPPIDQPTKKKGLKIDFDVLHGDSFDDASVQKGAGVYKRSSGSFSLELLNKGTYYSTIISIGSQKRGSRVLIDTGSADTWIMGYDLLCDYKPGSRRIGMVKSIDTKGKEENSFNVFNSTASEIFPVKDNKENFMKEGETENSLEGETEISLEGETEISLEGETECGSYEETELPSTKEERELISAEPEFVSTQSKSSSAFQKIEKYVSDANKTENVQPNTPEHKRRLRKAISAINPCNMFGTFNPDESDTFHRNKTAPDFHIAYVDKSYAIGYWGTDTVGFANEEIVLSFGVVNQTSSAPGILGIGCAHLESTLWKGPNIYTYANFPMQLKNSGIINKVVYSLHLNQKFSSTGSILFGAVDHKKYTGQLQTVPITDMYMGISLDNIYLETENQTTVISDEEISASLDSGSTYQHLPIHVLEALVNSMQGKYSSGLDLYEVDCAYMTDPASLVYDFSGVKIKVPVGNIVSEHDGSCYLGVSVLQDDDIEISSAILGNSFLQNAYVVYDLDEMEISMAQASYTADEDVEMVTTTIPRAIKAARYNHTNFQDSFADPDFIRDLYSNQDFSGIFS